MWATAEMSAVGENPMPVTEQHTSALDIRDAFYNALEADPYFADWTVRKNKWLPVQVDLIPYLGVYLIDELQTPDGDANAGCIAFVHTARIGFSIVVANNDEVLGEEAIDAGMHEIMKRLWTDAKINNVFQSSNPEGTLFEAVSRGTRRHVFGAGGTNNEFPWFECEYNVSIVFRSEWYPDIVDTLDEIDVTTGIKINESQADRDKRQQVTVKYMFNALRQALVKEET